ncbi:Gfo/Idh/MocA family protein [Phycisphaerales bacterium AB-hyl4]|uniref:Gfo/Idh/MocA family protein n=1 Tax=Natronomicrosphaera hydrolytica TaxID=3242702 RepID=A0ABV4U938_9BACT
MIRLGVIGAGGRGRIAKLAHRPEAGVEIAVACDTNEAVFDEYRQLCGSGLVTTHDWLEVVDRDDLDAIFIATPDFLHEAQAIAALDAGKIVYLEKPLAITIEGCDRVLAAADRGSGRLYVGHNMRFFPVMQKMKQIIDAGTIGDVQAIWCRHFVDYGGDAYFKDWHSEQRYSTGLLLQKGAHDIDMIHWFAGGYTQRTVGMGKLSVYNRVQNRRKADEYVSAVANEAHWPPLSQAGFSPIIDVEDHSMMLMQLDNGVQASYQQCHYTPDGHRNYTIIGTQGRIENIGCNSTDEHPAHIQLWTKRCGASINNYETITVPPVPGSHGGADPQIIDDFLNFIRTGQSRGACPLDARMSVAAGVMATCSLRQNNQPYDVPRSPCLQQNERASATLFPSRASISRAKL